MPDETGIEMHESFSRDYQPEATGNRRFGLVLGGLFVLFGSIHSVLHARLDTLGAILFVLGIGLTGAAVVRPEILGPANRAWARLGLLLHRFTNPIFLGVIYAGAIIPTGLVMRAFGVDPMGARRSRGDTYWIRRTKTSSTAQSIENPF